MRKEPPSSELVYSPIYPLVTQHGHEILRPVIEVNGREGKSNQIPPYSKKKSTILEMEIANHHSSNQIRGYIPIISLEIPLPFLLGDVLLEPLDADGRRALSNFQGGSVDRMFIGRKWLVLYHGSTMLSLYVLCIHTYIHTYIHT